MGQNGLESLNYGHPIIGNIPWHERGLQIQIVAIFWSTYLYLNIQNQIVYILYIYNLYTWYMYIYIYIYVIICIYIYISKSLGNEQRCLQELWEQKRDFSPDVQILGSNATLIPFVAGIPGSTWTMLQTSRSLLRFLWGHIDLERWKLDEFGLISVPQSGIDKVRHYVENNKWRAENVLIEPVTPSLWFCKQEKCRINFDSLYIYIYIFIHTCTLHIYIYIYMCVLYNIYL